MNIKLRTIFSGLLFRIAVAIILGVLLGDILHGLLVVVSSPMICSGHWAMSLFFWACLLISSARP